MDQNPIQPPVQTPAAPSIPVTPTPVAPVAAPSHTGMTITAIAGLVVLLALIAGGAYWYINGMPAPTPTPLVQEQPQDELAQIEAELSAEGQATYDQDVDNLESSF